MRRPGVFGCVVAAGALLMFLACGGFLIPLDVLFAITFGWIRHLARIVPLVQVEVGAAAGFVIAVTLAVVLTYWLTHYASPESAGEPCRNFNLGFRGSLIAVSLALILFVAGIALVGMTNQVVWLARSPEPLMDYRGSVGPAVSRNSLRQIGLSVNAFETANHRFPGADSFDENGRQRHSWLTSLLPYLEQHALYKRIDFERPWDSTKNQDVFRTPIDVMKYPQRLDISVPKDVNGFAPATYSANVRLLGPGHAFSFSHLPDGTSNTILAGEIRSHFPAWGDPTNLRDPALGVNRSENGFGSPWSFGAQLMMADGVVRRISREVDPDVLRQLATPDGHDGEIDLLKRFE